MPKPIKSHEPTEADLIRARYAVRYAELQRTAKRLLEQSSDRGLEDRRGGEVSQVEAAEEEVEEDFVVEDERAGLGYHAPQTSSSTTSQPNPHLSKASSSTEALRRRLLGKRAPSQPAAKPTFAPGSKPHPSKRHHQITDDDDEDDEESRSRLPSRHSTTNSRLKTKQPPPQPQPPPQSKIPPSKSPTSSPTTTTTPPAPPPPAAPPSPTASQIAASTVIGTKRKPAPGSYLEQLLAERAARRGVKKRKKKTKGEDG